MTSWLRLAWKLQRWELAILVGGALLLALAAVVVMWQLEVNGEAIADCHEQPAASFSAACRSLVELGNLLASSVGMLTAAATAAPFAVGIFLGAPLISREIEHRTAPIAWSLARSRRRWLAARLIPVLVIIGVALLLVGQATEVLLSSVLDDGLSFWHYGQHGPIVAARGLAVFGIGTLVGLGMGRVLPAVLLTALAAGALMAGASVVRDQLMRAEAEWLLVEENVDAVAMIYDSRLQDDATGEILTYEQVFAEYPPEELDPNTGVPPGMTTLYLAVSPDAYPSFLVRETAALAGITALVLALAWWVVPSRRPE